MVTSRLSCECQYWPRDRFLLGWWVVVERVSGGGCGVVDALLGPEGPGRLLCWGVGGFLWWSAVVAGAYPHHVGCGVCGVWLVVGCLFVENFTVDASIFVFVCVLSSF